MDDFESNSISSFNDSLLLGNSVLCDIKQDITLFFPNEIMLYIITLILIPEDEKKYDPSDNMPSERYGYEYYITLGKLRLINRRWNDIIYNAYDLWRCIYLGTDLIKHIDESIKNNKDLFCVQMAGNRKKIILYIFKIDQKYIDFILNRYLTRLDTIFIKYDLAFDSKIKIINDISRNPNTIKRINYYGYHSSNGDDINNIVAAPGFVRLIAPFVDYIYCDHEDDIIRIVDHRYVRTLKIINFKDCNKLLKGLNTCNELVNLTLCIYDDCLSNSVASINNINDLPCVTLENLDSLYFDIPNFYPDRMNDYDRHVREVELLNQIKIPNAKKLFIGNVTDRFTFPDCKVESLHVKSSDFLCIEFGMQLYDMIQKYRNTLEVVTLECDNGYMIEKKNL